MIANFIKEKNLATIIVFEELKIGAEFAATRISKSSISDIKLKIIGEENLSSLVEKGLDGAIVRRYTIKNIT